MEWLLVWKWSPEGDNSLAKHISNPKSLTSHYPLIIEHAQQNRERESIQMYGGLQGMRHSINSFIMSLSPMTTNGSQFSI